MKDLHLSGKLATLFFRVNALLTDVARGLYPSKDDIDDVAAKFYKAMHIAEELEAAVNGEDLGKITDEDIRKAFNGFGYGGAHLHDEDETDEV